MSNLLNLLGDLFTFLMTQLGNMGNFFVNTTLGQVILGMSVFYVIFEIVYNVISNRHK